ncbi:MAG: hypothetical protein WCF90_00850 [Methanomicrobiales archaeon]
MFITEKQKCEYCGMEAIGFQLLEGSFGYFCRDHLDRLLLAIKPGEKKICGGCVLERYS